MSDRKEIVDRLSRQLAAARALRAALEAHPAKAAARRRLRAWQSDRLARSHADLLADPRFAPAARFFLSDLYGPADARRLELQVERVVPVMARLLPAAGLETVADALELDALSELLDAAMLDALGRDIEALDGAAYGRAYRTVGRRPDRERQIRLIEHLGHALDHLTHQPLIGRTLAMMRRPARLAGFGDLQDFLQRGFEAVKATAGIDEFLRRIVARESQILAALFAGDDRLLDQ